jgi:hypothetical protein
MIETVLVCEAQVPVGHGGAESHVGGLVDRLDGRGCRAEPVSIPFRSYLKEELTARAPVWRLVEKRRG